MHGTTRNKHLPTSLYDAPFQCMDIFRNNTKLQYISPTCNGNVIAALYFSNKLWQILRHSQFFLLLTKTGKQKN